MAVEKAGGNNSPTIINTKRDSQINITKDDILNKPLIAAKPIDNSVSIITNKEYKGISVFSSEIGSTISPEEIKSFVKSCKQNFVIIDFAWITYHFPNTNLEAINKLAEDLQKQGVTAAVMYRPRGVGQQVHYEVLPGGEKSANLCYAHKDSIKWAAQWGVKILKSCPSIKNIILYNIYPGCQCELCKDGNGKKYIEQFFGECRSQWAAINPDIKIGHVGLEQNGNLYADFVDFICPFVVVNKPTGEQTLDIQRLAKDTEKLKDKYKTKPIIPLAKIDFVEATNNTTDDVIDVIKLYDRLNLGYCLWDYSFIFHNEEVRYDPAKIINAMGGDSKKLLQSFKTQVFNKTEASNPAKAEEGPKLTLPPEDKPYPLPWPHQAPGLTPEQIKKLNEEVFIINNQSLSVASDDGTAYLHDGIDIALANGTKIYAMEDGYVKSASYGCIQIAKRAGAEPCYGWAYAHMDDIKVKQGQYVPKGTLLGVVDFKQGIEHLHLSRIFSEGDYWGIGNGKWCYFCAPDGHFDYVDTKPPIIGSNFYFFKNEQEKQFPKDSNARSVVNGEVDVVVPIREAGQYTEGKIPHGGDAIWGNWLAVSKIEYEITPINKDLCQTYKSKSFDFTKTNLKVKGAWDDKYHKEQFGIVYKHWNQFINKIDIQNAYSYYTITNSPPNKTTPDLTSEQKNYSWKTNQKNPDGTARFPNGAYKITITAYDFKGNSAIVSNEVVVENK